MSAPHAANSRTACFEQAEPRIGTSRDELLSNSSTWRNSSRAVGWIVPTPGVSCHSPTEVRRACGNAARKHDPGSRAMAFFSQGENHRPRPPSSLPERTSGGLAGDRQRGGDGANFDADGRHSRRGRTHGAANTSLGAGWREHHAGDRTPEGDIPSYGPRTVAMLPADGTLRRATRSSASGLRACLRKWPKSAMSPPSPASGPFLAISARSCAPSGGSLDVTVMGGA
jgi:hypothetical protein